MKKEVSSWHIGIAAEAFAAAQFARFGIDVSVQYGANQPEYDLIATKGDKMLKVSVKGSQDGGWGLTQTYKTRENSYHDAIDSWLKAHGKKTIFCLVQFKHVEADELPRMYLATPEEIAHIMKESRIGNGDTILYEYHKWTSRSIAAGTEEKIPEEWAFTEKRANQMFEETAAK